MKELPYVPFGIPTKLKLRKMEKELQERVLIKIGNEQNLTEKEEKCILVLQREGLVEVSEEDVKLTPRGKVVSVIGFNSFRRAEEMEESFANFSTENLERNKLLVLMLFALVLLVLLTSFWMYFEDLFFL